MQQVVFAENFFNEIDINLADSVLTHMSIFKPTFLKGANFVENSFNRFTHKIVNTLTLLEKVIEENVYKGIEVDDFKKGQVEKIETFCKNMKDTANSKNAETAEILMADPFNVPIIERYEGDPNVSFTEWFEKFNDSLRIISPPLSDQQQLARFRFSLAGHARFVFDEIRPSPLTIHDAFAHLKTIFEGENARSIARQKLSACRQCSGEPIFSFASRLAPVVRAAMSGEAEEAIKRRLLDEFLDKLLPDLAFHVKGQRPKDYLEAFDLAQHWEILLAANKTNASVFVAENSREDFSGSLQKFEAKRLCYGCRQPGHMRKNCPKKIGRNLCNNAEKGERNVKRCHSQNKNLICNRKNFAFPQIFHNNLASKFHAENRAIRQRKWDWENIGRKIEKSHSPFVFSGRASPVSRAISPPLMPVIEPISWRDSNYSISKQYKSILESDTNRFRQNRHNMKCRDKITNRCEDFPIY